MNLYDLTDATCGCKQHPSFLFPTIWHTCKPRKTPAEVFRNWDEDDGWLVETTSGFIPVVPEPRRFDVLDEEEARAPIMRYLRGGVPEYDEPPFMEGV